MLSTSWIRAFYHKHLSLIFILWSTSLSSLHLWDIYVPFPQKKKSALFEVSEVVPVMTNNYEENILKGVKNSSYSLESSLELIQKDVVQLHAPRYQSMRRVSQYFKQFSVSTKKCFWAFTNFCSEIKLWYLYRSWPIGLL